MTPSGSASSGADNDDNVIDSVGGGGAHVIDYVLGPDLSLPYLLVLVSLIFFVNIIISLKI
jgi:hypothetical protein